MTEAETLLRQLLVVKEERARTLRELVAVADDRETDAWHDYLTSVPLRECPLLIAEVLVALGAHLQLPEGCAPFYSFDYVHRSGDVASPNPYDLTARLQTEPPLAFVRAFQRLGMIGSDPKNLWAWIYAVFRNSGIGLIPPDKAETYAGLPDRVTIYRYFGLRTDTARGSPTSQLAHLKNAIRGFSWSLSPVETFNYGGGSRGEHWRKFRATAIIEKASIISMPPTFVGEVVIDRPDLIPAAAINLEEIHVEDVRAA